MHALLRARVRVPDRQVPPRRHRGREPAGGVGLERYLDGAAGVLAALDEVAAAHSTTVAAVALAWLRAQPGVTAPIASARSPEQLAELLPMAELELRPDELDRLTSAHGEA